MKSCLGMLITLLILLAVVGTGVGLWYLSKSATFERRPAPSSGSANPAR